MIRLYGAARTDVGLKRQNNEDTFFIDNDLGLFIVADGMGGHAAGEVASAMVADTISSYIKHFQGKPENESSRFGFQDPTQSALANTILQSIHLATKVVYDAAQKNENYHSMGSTLVMVMAEGDDLLVAHVGDSPCFRLRNNELKMLTKAHRLADDPQFEGIIDYNSTMVSKLGNTLTRAMGIKTDVLPDLQRCPIQWDDIYLLCSDGLTDMVTEEIITQVLESDSNLETKTDQLVEFALAGGGSDNITVVLISPSAGNKVLRGLLGRFKK